jgi:hypothetical protein
MTQKLSKPEGVLAQIASLSDAPMNEIKALWRQLFDSDTPTHNRSFLERRIAYQLQQQAYPQPELIALNLARLNALAGARQRSNKYAMVPGMQLEREYRNELHCVRVLADGQFEYRGQRYNSLSIIATLITGARWSGPLFFGLRGRSNGGAK